jgi:hypothetical protein
MPTLDELAIKHCTDKASHSHAYMTMYAQWMESSRGKPIKLLEIGLGLGGSARMWVEAFPNAEIWVIDIKPTVNAEGAKIICGPQQDPAVWMQLPFGFDFIIDDGSHIPDHQIKSLHLGFPKLNPGGMYFIEDCHCAQHPNFNPSQEDILYSYIWSLMRQQQLDWSSGDFYKTRNGLDGLARDIYAYHFYKSVICLERAK